MKPQRRLRSLDELGALGRKQAEAEMARQKMLRREAAVFGPDPFADEDEDTMSHIGAPR